MTTRIILEDNRFTGPSDRSNLLFEDGPTSSGTTLLTISNLPDNGNLYLYTVSGGSTQRLITSSTTISLSQFTDISLFYEPDPDFVGFDRVQFSVDNLLNPNDGQLQTINIRVQGVSDDAPTNLRSASLEGRVIDGYLVANDLVIPAGVESGLYFAADQIQTEDALERWQFGLTATDLDIDQGVGDELEFRLISSAPDAFEIVEAANNSAGALSILRIKDGAFFNGSSLSSIDLTVRVTDETGNRIDRTFNFDVQTYEIDSPNSDADIFAYNSVTAGSDTVFGTALDEVINGGAGDDWIVGGGGSDILRGEEGNDTLEATDPVRDILIGSSGADTYVIGQDANGFINEASGDTDQSIVDTVSLRDSKIVDIAADVTGGNATSLRIVDSTQSMEALLHLQLDTTQTERFIEALHIQDRIFEFVTGSSGTIADEFLIGREGISTVFAGAGNDILQANLTSADTLRGEDGDDFLIAGRGGTDVLLGASGSDQYVIGTGDGVTLVNEAGSSNFATTIDRLILTESSVRDIKAIHFSDSLYITDSNVGFQARLFNHFNQAQIFRQIEEIEFADGSVYQLTATKDGQGTSGDDFIVSGQTTDSVSTGSGSDIVIFGSSRDILDYGTGDEADWIVGFSTGQDVIDVSDTAVDDFVDLQSIMEQQGEDVIIDFGSGDIITLANTDIGSLSSDDFVFGT